MKVLLALVAFAASIDSGAVYAHAHLQQSAPANNSTVTAAPKTLLLQFNDAVIVTALSVQKSAGQQQTLSPLPTAAAKQVSVPLPALSPGSYAVKWRAMSADNHIMSGTLLFTIAPPQTTASK